jgi:hypothetical protein
MLFSDEQKLLLEGGKKGFVKNTKLGFMSLKNESTLRLILARSSMENPCSSLGNPRESNGFSLSNTEHLCRNTQSRIRTSSPALRQ